VQLSTGVVVVEATPGQQVLRVALPPGEYLVRRVTEGGVLSRPVTVLADKVTTVDEASLTLVGEPALAPKSAAPPLAGDHALAISAMVMPGNFGTGLGGQLAYRWRFLRSLGLRLRGALGTPLSNGLSEQMMRDFAVFPTAFKVNTLAIGTDLEWLPQPEPLGAGGLTVGLAVGVGVLGSSTLDFSSVTFAPAGTGSLRLGVHLPWLPNLETQAEISVHVGVVSGSPVFQGQLTAGFAWHFHHR
jgi:hypothetical protein